MTESGERNLRLIREIEANREFLLMVYRRNPELAARAEPRIRQLLTPLPAANAPPPASEPAT